MISDVVSHRKSILFTSTLNIEHMIFSEFATRALAFDFGVLGEWRFERKCFRANIETSAAKTRRSRIIFLLISVGEEFVVFHLLHFYTEDRSFADVTFARSANNFDHRTSWALDESKQETIPVLENTC